MLIRNHIIERARNKALQSNCQYKISAIGLNKKGEVIGSAINKHRFGRIGGGYHAEMVLMANYQSVKTIIICRVGRGGDLLPVHPCDNCQQKANELGVKILSIQP